MKNYVSFFQLLGLIAAVAFASSCVKQKEKQERQENEKPKGDITDIAKPVTTPGWITFKPEAKVDPKTLFKDHAAMFHLPPGNEMVVQSEETDELGITHFRYRQFFKNVEVEHAEFLVRAKGGRAVSANGKLAYDFQPQTTAPQLSEEQAWAIVQRRIPAQRYFREDKLVDDLANLQPAPYRPKGKLVFTENPAGTGGERVLAWMFKVYVTPFDNSRQIYINAADGSVVKELPLFPACYLGSGPVTFRGTRPMNTQKRGDLYYLVDDCDGNLLTAGLLDAANKVVNIFDDDNNWANNNPSVVTSYWGLRATYDYFNLIHHRVSYDGKNGNMTIYNDPNMDNGGHNARGGGGFIRIGLANPGDNDDYNTLDIVGHEFTHSVVEQTAALDSDATKESSALTESFCDIFGQLTEQWIEGGTKKDWVIGDDKGCSSPYICRDLQNPKAFKGPDTYKGSNWQAGKADPHNNGCVQNRWFYLLSDGETGTNTELGSSYNVPGIGLTKAGKIVYRSLTRYLNSAAAYADARNASLNAAADLFGDNSREVDAVDKAWCAVGLCSYVIPTQPDKFDQPGGNPNPASPNNNNTIAGATPLGTGSHVLGTGYPWSTGKLPALRVSNLSIFPANDIDYFKITFPQVDLIGGRCFSSGIAFVFGTPVNARIFVNGSVYKTFVNASDFSISPGEVTEPIVLEVTAPFPGQILSYSLDLAFYLHYKSDCFQPGRPNVWDEIRSCPMCDLQVLKGFDRVILDPLYRQPDHVEIQDHYFSWKGGGALQIPINILQGNDLHVELLNEKGERVAETDRKGASDVILSAPQAGAGVYSLRFSGFGNGTEILVRTPRQ